MICGANATSMKLVALTMSAWEQSAFGLTGFSAWETGPATAAMSTVAGSRITTDQVISADAVCSTWTFASGSPALARLAERASTGTIALDRAPPIASSTIRLGTWLAVTYAVPRQPAPTVFANTTVRTRPRTRENAVSTATMIAPRAIPRATLPLPASLSSSSESGRDGSARPAVSVCTAPCPLARRHGPLRTGYGFPALFDGPITPFPARWGAGAPPHGSRREPASLAARCSPTVTGSYLAGLSLVTQLGRHSITASTLPSWK